MIQRNICRLVMLGCILLQIVSACRGLGTPRSQAELEPGIKETLTPVMTSSDNNAGPIINSISTSSKGFSIDCVPTSITVTANLTHTSEITHVLLWYRVQPDQMYMVVKMELITENEYGATVQALDLPVGKNGTWEFYITAEDEAGHQSQSPLDGSVQLLPCVGQ